MKMLNVATLKCAVVASKFNSEVQNSCRLYDVYAVVLTLGMMVLL